MFRYLCLFFVFISFQSISAVAPESVTNSLQHPTTGTITYKIVSRKDDIVTKFLFDELAKKFNFKVQYVYCNEFSDVINALTSNQADFTGNITYSDQRAKILDISSPTNIEYTYFYSAHTGSKHTSLKAVKRIAVAKNIIFKKLINDRYPNIKVIEFDSIPQAKAMINSGEVDGVVDSVACLSTFLHSGFDALVLNDRLPIQPVGLATQKGKHSQLVKKMVAYVHTPSMQKKLRTSVERYQFDIRQQALRKAVTEAGIDRNSPIKVKFENLIQFSQYAKDGSVYGISADILNKACNILDLQCDIISHANEAWDDMYADLRNKKIDILGPVTITASRKKAMYFSQEYFLPEAIAVKREGYKEGTYKNVSEMIVERISVIKGDYYDHLLTDMLPQKKLYRLRSRDEQIKSLLAGKTDYAILNKQNFNKMQQGNDAMLPIVEDALIGSFHRSELGFAFVKTEKGKKLADLFTLAINLVDTTPIINKYDVQPDWRAMTQKEQKSNQVILWILIFNTVFLSSVIWYVHRQSTTDNLTKLKNRRALYQKYSRGIPANKTVVYLDVNKFKHINDTYGHQVGDEVLKQLSQRILTHWRAHSFRLGGDEFVLIGMVTEAELQTLLEPILAFDFLSESGEHFVQVNASLGFSMPRAINLPIDEVLHLADVQMYKNKQNKT